MAEQNTNVKTKTITVTRQGRWGIRQVPVRRQGRLEYTFEVWGRGLQFSAACETEEDARVVLTACLAAYEATEPNPALS